MPVRVEFVKEVVEDLERYVASGFLDQFLAKLVRLEDVGRDAGQPLGSSLTGWQKIVVGDRNWRVLFRIDEQNTVATVMVIGDRADDECYRIAQRRLAALQGPPETVSLAGALAQLLESRGRRERRRR